MRTRTKSTAKPAESETALDVFESMRGSRARANAAVMGAAESEPELSQTDGYLAAIKSDAPPAPATTSNDLAAPRADKNVVIQLAPGYIVERTDPLNWTAKVLRKVNASHFRAKHAERWEVIGYYGTPAGALRRLATLMCIDGETGVMGVDDYLARFEAASKMVEPKIIASEKAAVLLTVADSIVDPKAAAIVRRNAEIYVRVANAGADEVGEN